MKGFLCLGSNLGDRMGMIRAAIEGLKGEGVEVVRLSSVYETKPLETPDPQENYFNLVAEIEWAKSPLELLKACRRVEDGLGRQRPYRNAPRTMDIDIILLEGVSMRTAELTIPHPRMESRSFVIFPLSEIAPCIALPSGRHIIEVKNELPNDEIVRMWAF